MPDDFEARQGLKLTPEYVVGKEIGGGVQGRVFTLEGPNGEDTGKLLKVSLALEQTLVCYGENIPFHFTGLCIHNSGPKWGGHWQAAQCRLFSDGTMTS